MPKDVLETFMGATFNPEGLDAKTRLLLTLAALTILGAQAEAQIRLTVRHALEAGATQQEVAETIALMGVFGGVPAMTKAMELAREVMERQRGRTGHDRRRFRLLPFRDLGGDGGASSRWSRATRCIRCCG